MMKQMFLSVSCGQVSKKIEVLHVVYHVKLHVKHVNMIDGFVTRNTTQQQIFIVYTFQIEEMMSNVHYCNDMLT